MSTVVVITGPTATGKTELGALFAKSAGGEVVSADSMQIYKFMDVGTAKPSAEERLGVPHHMLDIIPPWEDYSAARYIEDAARCVDDILRRGKLPVIVGGTGLYIDSLLSGRTFSVRGDAELRRGLEAEYDAVGGNAMLRRLAEFDPKSAEKLSPNDKKRVVRAIEAYTVTGKPISLHDEETRALPPRYEAVKFALNFSERSRLNERIDRRVDMMFGKGLVSEVRALLDMGVPSGATAMQAIGYKETAGALLGGGDMTAASDMIKTRSRQYAKRQVTWLRRNSAVEWIMWDKAPDMSMGIERINRICRGER